LPATDSPRKKVALLGGFFCVKAPHMGKTVFEAKSQTVSVVLTKEEIKCKKARILRVKLSCWKM